MLYPSSATGLTLVKVSGGGGGGAAMRMGAGRLALCDSARRRQRHGLSPTDMWTCHQDVWKQFPHARENSSRRSSARPCLINGHAVLYRYDTDVIRM